jgi:hypothetical protein
MRLRFRVEVTCPPREEVTKSFILLQKLEVLDKQIPPLAYKRT